MPNTRRVLRLVKLCLLDIAHCSRELGRQVRKAVGAVVCDITKRHPWGWWEPAWLMPEERDVRLCARCGATEFRPRSFIAELQPDRGPLG